MIIYSTAIWSPVLPLYKGFFVCVQTSSAPAGIQQVPLSIHTHCIPAVVRFSAPETMTVLVTNTFTIARQLSALNASFPEQIVWLGIHVIEFSSVVQCVY